MQDNIIIITGGFDPLHRGHISAINEAAQYGRVIIGLNSDEWLVRKKGRAFMQFQDRRSIIENLKQVLCVIDFDDSDNTAADCISKTMQMFPKSKIIFANGGDRDKNNTPEQEVYKDDPKIEFIFGVGGTDKKNSSSWILQEWKSPKTERGWGYYRVLHEVPGMKVKELTVDPHSQLSMQKHEHRNEFWIVSSGSAILNSQTENGYQLPPKQLGVHDSFVIYKNQWHQLVNRSDVPCKVVEVQYGDICTEEDIVRI